MTYLIGTDIGTLGTKSVLTDLNGKILSSAFQEYGVITPNPGWAEQWPQVWFDAVCKTIQSVLKAGSIDSKDVAGICFSGLAPSIILCDGQINPLRPSLIWADRRATEECEWVKKNIGEEHIFKVTGNIIDPYYGYTKILYAKSKEPKIWQKTRHILTSIAYCIYKLTGSLSIDLSNAGNLGGVFDIHKREWSEELLAEFGIPRALFPEKLSSSSSVVGEVTHECENMTGLKKGTPVMAGGVDAPVSALSSGAIQDGDLSCMLGTSMCNGFINEKLRLSPKMINYPYVIDDQRMLYSFTGVVTAGYCLRWFRDQLGRQESSFAEQLDISGYKILDMEAEKIPPGSEGILFLPHMMVGERAPYWDNHLRGTLAGLTVYHTKAHMFRAFLEGVSYALRYCIESALEAGMTLERTLLIDGGAKSPLWRRIITDVTGIPIGYIADAVGAPLGDALLAGIGSGALKDHTAIRDWVKVTEIIKPDPENKKTYDKYYTLFKKLSLSIKDIFIEF